MVCIYYLTVLLILNLRFESTVKTKGYQTINKDITTTPSV